MQHWQITRTQHKVSDFVSWQRNGTLVLSPSFQRRPVWSSGAKSFLIDTVVRGLPMPVIFLRELPADLVSKESEREVVDGQQRIRTLLTFASPELIADFNPKADDFTIRRTHNRDHAGKRFRDLEDPVQQRILDYQFSVHVFPADTDDREVLQIFARMNSTGVALNAQELRNAGFFGEFKTLAYELAAEQLPKWRKWGIFSEQQLARMNEVELTSELLTLMLQGVTQSTKASIDRAYKDFDAVFDLSEEAGRRFRSMMDCLDDQFSADISSLFSRRPIFYCLFAAVYGLTYQWASLGAQVRPPRIDHRAVKHGCHVHHCTIDGCH